jgi:hypothetical protein
MIWVKHVSMAQVANKFVDLRTRTEEFETMADFKAWYDRVIGTDPVRRKNAYIRRVNLPKHTYTVYIPRS